VSSGSGTTAAAISAAMSRSDRARAASVASSSNGVVEPPKTLYFQRSTRSCKAKYQPSRRAVFSSPINERLSSAASSE
jgi:hypothetical protein